MKNYSELIRDKKKRQLSAKGNKFLNRCIDIIADQNNTNRYAPEMKPVKDKIRVLLHHLMIDKECSLEDIKIMIKNRTINNIKLTN